MRDRKKTELPEEYMNIKHIALNEIDEDYILLEDGRLWSRKVGKFKKTLTSKDGYLVYKLTRKDTKKCSIFPVECLVRKYFIKTAPIDQVEYKHIVDNNKYYVTKDGRIFNVRNCSFVKPAKTNTGWLIVGLIKDHKRVSTYVARAVYQTFVGPIERGYRLKFIDGDKSNCRLQNLTIQKIKSFKG